MSQKTPKTYDIGDSPLLDIEFINNLTGNNADPSVVTCYVYKPDGNTDTYVYGTDSEFVKLSTGVYYVEVDATLAGEWRFRFVSTGTAKGAESGKFIVRANTF
jgi:hypothetical protein